MSAKMVTYNPLRGLATISTPYCTNISINISMPYCINIFNLENEYTYKSLQTFAHT